MTQVTSATSWLHLIGGVLVIFVLRPSAAQLCTGDCGGDGAVTVNELVLMVNIALDTQAVSACTPGDRNGDGEITITEIIAAVNYALDACPAVTPSPASTPTPTPTPTGAPSECPLVGFSVPAVQYPAGTGPSSATVGDFGSNTGLDLAVTNRGSNTVSVMRSDRVGGFGSPTAFAVGNAPSAVASDDFNNDGVADLAVTNEGSSTVSILLGKSDGGFAAAKDYSVGSGPYAVVIGEFTGDHNLDVVTANPDSDNLSLLPGDGTGGFGAAVSVAVGHSPRAVAVAGYSAGSSFQGDFNGDFLSDLVVANAGSNNVSVLLGNTAGGFQPAATYTVGNFPVAVVVGEFNGDHNADIAVANRDSNNVSILLGDGNGGFSAARTFGAGDAPVAIATGDFSGDGKADLVVASSSSNKVSLLVNDGVGGFAAAGTFAVGTGPSALAGGNFNFTQDRHLDVAVADAQSNDVSVLLNVNTGPASNGSIVVFEGLRIDSTHNPTVSLANVSNTLVRAFCFYATQPGCQITSFDFMLPKKAWVQWQARTGNGTIPAVPAIPFSGELVCVEVDVSGAPYTGNHLVGSVQDVGACGAIATPITGDATNSNADNTLCLGGGISDQCQAGAEYGSCPVDIDPAHIETCWSQAPLPYRSYTPTLTFVCGG